MQLNDFWKSLTLLAFAFAILIYGYLTTVDSANPRYQVQWQHSQWVTTPTPTPIGYYRIDIDMDSKIERGVLQIAATDKFVFYINGQLIDEKFMRSSLVTGVYDIGRYLNTGKNTIAVQVNRATFPAEVKLRYELTVLDKQGRNFHYHSGSELPRVQHLLPRGTTALAWYAPGYDDSQWPAATKTVGTGDVTQISYDPELLLTLPQPTNYTISGVNSWKLTLSQAFDFDPAQQEQVWFTLGSNVPYEVDVNGISLGVFSANNNELLLRSIRSKLVTGRNSIGFSLMTSGHIPVIAGGVIFDSAEQTRTLFLDDTWIISAEGSHSLSGLNELVSLQSLDRGQLAFSSFQPDYRFVIDDSFVSPGLFQLQPWLTLGKFVLIGAVVFVFFSLQGISAKQQLDATLLANGIGILLLLSAWFIAQDVRFNARVIFSSQGMNLLFLGWLLMVLVSLSDVLVNGVKFPKASIGGHYQGKAYLGNFVFFAIGLAVVGLAFILRFNNIGLQALTVDEATIAGFARGVLERGYPYLMVGGMEVDLATYELVPFFLAAALKVFGYSDIALRIPALMFGVATCALIIYCGTKWFGRLAGLVAGLLYAVSPWAIYWGKNCFHPSQIQFFNLLALVVFYRLLSAHKISLKLAFLAAIAFAFSYLSWEGAGLVLPIMAMVAIAIRWQDWKWFMQPNLWIGALLILFVIGAQGVRRMLLQEPYIMVGFGKSDLATPKLTFTDASYDPMYYLQNFFFTETHIGLSLFFIIGFILMFYDRKLSFVILFVVMAYLSLTNLLGYYNAHYFYFVLPVFLLAVAAVFVKLLMLIQQYLAEHRTPAARVLGGITAILMASVLFIPASSNVLQLHRLLAESIDQMRVDYRPNLAGMDGRTVSLALNQYWRQGDVILSSVPLISEHYAGHKGDYFVQTITDRKVVYDTEKTSPYYVDKFVGNPVLRSHQELQDVLEDNRRVFFVAAPVNGLTRIIDAETLDFINQNMTVVAESYDSRLYLWER
jgi:hypothetical protein